MLAARMAQDPGEDLRMCLTSQWGVHLEVPNRAWISYAWNS